MPKGPSRTSPCHFGRREQVRDVRDHGRGEEVGDDAGGDPALDGPGLHGLDVLALAAEGAGPVHVDDDPAAGSGVYEARESDRLGVLARRGDIRGVGVGELELE